MIFPPAFVADLAAVGAVGIADCSPAADRGNRRWGASEVGTHAAVVGILAAVGGTALGGGNRHPAVACTHSLEEAPRKGLGRSCSGTRTPALGKAAGRNHRRSRHHSLRRHRSRRSRAPFEEGSGGVGSLGHACRHAGLASSRDH